MALADIIAKLLELLGLKKGDAQKYDQTERQLRSAKATNTDRLENLKEKIAALEHQAKAQNAKYKTANGDTKRIIGGEIERTCKDLDLLQGQETIISQNLGILSLALAKLDEWRVAKEQGVDEDMLDSLAIELEDVFADLKATGRTAKGLEGVHYEAPQAKQMDIDGRMAELQGEAPASEGLSQSTAERLKALDEE